MGIKEAPQAGRQQSEAQQADEGFVRIRLGFRVYRV